MTQDPDHALRAFDPTQRDGNGLSDRRLDQRRRDLASQRPGMPADARIRRAIPRAWTRWVASWKRSDQ